MAFLTPTKPETTLDIPGEEMAQDHTAQDPPRKRGPGRPRNYSPKVPSEPTGRYVECPQGRHTHEPRLVPVKKGIKRFHWRCVCTANGVMSETWKPDMGYTLEQAREFAKAHNWTIVGH